MKTWQIDTLEELNAAAKEILELSKSADISGATVLGLHGDLGAGKTTFVQLLGKQLGVEETITSPTFVIMKGYATKGRFLKLVHIDAYRIESVDELRVLGFAELLSQKDTIICIEWAEQVASLLPQQMFHLSFSLNGSERKLTLTYNDSKA